MSTSKLPHDNTGSPFDTDELARLANQYFSAVPGADFSRNSHPIVHGVADVLLAQLTGTSNHSALPGLPDANASAPLLPPVTATGFTPTPPDYPFSNTATASSTQAEQARYGTLPPPINPGPAPSVTGSGASPSAYGLDLPHSNEPSLAAELQGLVSQAHTPASTQQGPQLPGAATLHGGTPAYYFLEAPRLESNQPQTNYSTTGSGGASHGSTPVAAPRNDSAQSAGQAALARPPFDVNLIRRDFPILSERVNGRPLIWFDNAATTQKPQAVIDRLAHFYKHENSNIHRAAHELAARATDAYEGARETVRRFVNAQSVNEIVFTRGTTESINLVAQSWGRTHIHAGDEIIVSNLEHHANIVPWHRLAEERGAKLRVIPVDDDGQLLLDEYVKLLNPRTKLVAFTQVSNALGTVTPAKRIIDLAKQNGSTVLLDGAQSISHLRVDLQYLQPDFFVFSGHKIYGPTGIGVVYGREALLNSLPPWQGGGNMIQDVTFEKIQYHDAPNRFEAGTGNIADAVGLGAALDYVNKLGIENIDQYEHQLLLYATRLIKDVPGLRIVGTAEHKASVLSFVLDGFSTEQVGNALNKEGIAVRSGHHCAQPILRRFGLEATVRPSLAFYNTCAEVDHLVNTLHKLKSGHISV